MSEGTAAGVEGGAPDFPPFVAIGPDELGDAVQGGEMVVCKKCGGAHPLVCATGEDGQPTTLLMAYRCGTTSYLGAVGGRLLRDIRRAETPTPDKPKSKSLKKRVRKQ